MACPQGVHPKGRTSWRSTEAYPVCCDSQVFSLVIFSSLLTDGYQNRTESPQLRCVLNSNHMACSFAVGAGFLSFLSCLVFLAADAHESRIVGTRFKTAFQLLDFILAGEFQGTVQSSATLGLLPSAYSSVLGHPQNLCLMVLPL